MTKVEDNHTKYGKSGSLVRDCRFFARKYLILAQKNLPKPLDK